MPRKKILTKELFLRVVEENNFNLFNENNCIAGPKKDLWKKIAKEINKEIFPNSLHERTIYFFVSRNNDGCCDALLCEKKEKRIDSNIIFTNCDASMSSNEVHAKENVTSNEIENFKDSDKENVNSNEIKNFKDEENVNSNEIENFKNSEANISENSDILKDMKDNEFSVSHEIQNHIDKKADI